MKCPECKSKKISNDGSTFSVLHQKPLKRYRCKDCKKRFQESTSVEYDIKHVNKIPNVLLIDIETAPRLGMFFNVWKNNQQPEFLIEDIFILCWSAKWLFHNEMVSDCVTPKEAVNCDDKRIMKHCLKLLNQADVIIAHNGNKFDLPIINMRLALNGFNPYTPIQKIDTLQEYKKHFKFTWNRLNWINQIISGEKKIKTDAELWKACKKGSKEHLDYMSEYCDKDILLLEEAYVFIRPWIKSHPNLALYAETDQTLCPNCLSNDLNENGEYITPANVYKSFTCGNCGSHSRGRISELTKKQKEKLQISQAR